MFSKIGSGQLCGFMYLFILLTSMLSKFMAGAPPDLLLDSLQIKG